MTIACLAFLLVAPDLSPDVVKGATEGQLWALLFIAFGLALGYVYLLGSVNASMRWMKENVATKADLGDLKFSFATLKLEILQEAQSHYASKEEFERQSKAVEGIFRSTIEGVVSAIGSRG